MSRKQKKIGSVFATAVGSVFLSFLFAQSVHALTGISFEDYNDSTVDKLLGRVSGELEGRYHLNLRSIQDQGENFNVSSQKGESPQVLLYFNPSDPKPGSELEARAFPEFFQNAGDTLYYTWYIKRKGCGLDDSPDENKRNLCDWNGDKKITVEDWKIEAMQSIAARNFDATCSLNGNLSNEERATCAENMYNSAASSRINPTGTKGTDGDRDGYRASFGGDGRSMFADDCTPSPGSGGDSGDTDNFVPSDALVGDPPHPSIRLSSSATSILSDAAITATLSATDTLYESVFGFPEVGSEFCYETYGVELGEPHGSYWCSGTEGGNWDTVSAYTRSGDTLEYTSSYSTNGTWRRTVTPVSSIFPAGHTYHLFWRDSTTLSMASAKLTVTGGEPKVPKGTCTGSGVCYIHDFGDGYNYELPSCKHLFPKSYEITDNGNIKKVGDIGDSDGSFPIKEEHFWLTDPENPSTSQNGNKDEANIAGMGQDTFRWTYAPGDKVGVVVEGASMYNTKYANSSMMIMWALPRNKCEVKDKSSRVESIKGYNVPILTAKTDIDDCLEDNLVDPAEGGQSENIELSLSATPEAPSAKLIPWDATASTQTVAKTGDILQVNASSSNASQASSSSYTWRIQASKDGMFNSRFSNENVWTDITKELQTAKNIGVANGNNITSLSIDLNLNKTQFTDPKTQTIIPGFDQYFVDDVAYFRILVSVTENFSGAVSRSGVSSIVVKVVANKSIDVYDVDTVKNAEGLVSVQRTATTFCTPTSQTGSPSASGIFQQTICPVLNNQIVGVNLATSADEIRDYSWTLNDHLLTCTSAVSSECSNDKQGSVNFFPVSGKVGDLYVLTVVASNAETGKSFTVSRRFQIVDPDFDIVSNDTEMAWPKYLGRYVNLDGSESDDMSKTSFEGVAGGVAKLSAIFRPTVLGTFILNGIKSGDDQNEMVWSINGKPFKWNDTGLSLSLDGNAGGVYTVTLSGAYNQSRELRKALYDIWRISPFSSETERFSKEIQIQLVDGNDYLGKAKSNTFFASILSAVPPFVLFSVRLILSMGLILLIIGVVFSFAPETKEDRV